jgi:UDP-GlcNAc:undecaprenyl-phosphate GlcNAc-1-phosphate transferase
MYFDLILIYLLILIGTIFISKKLKFYDIPNNRKVHSKPILNTSGLSFYLFLIYLISNYEFSFKIEEIITVGFFAFLTGFLDDRINITPGVKLIGLFFPTIYIILKGYYLKDLGIYDNFGLLELGKFSIIFSILSIGLLINSINYIDGIDGLLLSISIVIFCYFIFLIEDNKNLEIMFLIILIPLIINLLFNFLSIESGIKLFSGNGGSLFLGFFIGLVMIYLKKFENIHSSYLIWSVCLPVYDFLDVTIYRIRKGIKFYNPDQKHLHHLFVKKLKFSHMKTSMLICIIHISLIFSGYLTTKKIGPDASLLMFIILFLLFVFIKKKSFSAIK